MKATKRLLFLLGAIFLPLTSGCSNLNSQIKDEESSINDNIDDNFNNEEISKEEKEKEQIKTLVFNNLNKNNHYNIERNSYITFISDQNTPVKVDFIGEVIFNESNISYSSLDLDFSYSSKKESISLINNFSINSTLKHNDNIVTFDSNSDLNYLLNYLNVNENYKDAPTFSYSNFSFSSIFNNVFNSLFIDESTSKNTKINDSININESSILVKNNDYSLYLDDSYNIKRIVKNDTFNKDSNLPIKELDLIFTNTYNEVAKLNENSDNLVTTLYEYFENSALNIDFDVSVNGNKDFHFIGDMNLDFTNSSLINNNKFDISFLHYTNKNTANDKVYLRYQNNNAYFLIYENLDYMQNTDNVEPFLKGRMSDKGISSLFDVISNYTDIDFNEYVNMPLNSLFNTTSFKEISTTQDISTYLDSIKSYSLKNNVLFLTIDSSVFGLPKSLLDIKIGLQNLKLKTIDIKNLRIDEETTIDASLRINELIELKPYDLSSFPSYDFLPGMIESISSLVNRKTLGGKMNFQLFDIRNSKSLSFSSNIDLNASRLDFNNLSLDSISNFDLALTNLSINGLSEGISQLVNILKGIYIQENPLTGEKSLIIELDILNQKYFLSIAFSDINSLITKIMDLISSLMGDTLDIDFEQILSTIKYYVEAALNDYQLKKDIDYIIENISLRPLEKFLKIDVNEEWQTLEITIDPEYIFQYEMSVNDPSFSPYIKILYDTKYQDLIGLYVNIATHDGNYVVNFNYGYDDFDKSNFLDINEITSGKELPFDTITDVIDLFTNQTNNTFDNSKSGYNLSTSITSNDSKSSNTLNINGSVILDSLGSMLSGNIDISNLSASSGAFLDQNNPLNLMFKYYGEKKDKQEGTSEQSLYGLDYYSNENGEITFKNTMVANLKLKKSDKSAFKIISPSSSLMDIIETIKNLDTSNLLYSYLEAIIKTLNSNFFLLYIIENNGISSLLSEEYIKIKSLDDSSSSLSLSIELNSILFKTFEDENDIPTSPSDNWVNIELKANKEFNEEIGKNLFSISTLKVSNLEFENMGNISLNLSRDESLSEDTILSEFVDYDSTNEDIKNDFMNVKDIATLIVLGMNTTQKTNFRITGYLNLNLAIDLRIFDVGMDPIEDRKVTANIKVENTELLSQTKAHLIIEKTNDPGYLDNNGKYIEYFTERLIDGEEICYIAKTYGEYKGPEYQVVEPSVKNKIVYGLTNPLTGYESYTGYDSPINTYEASNRNAIATYDSFFSTESQRRNDAVNLVNQINADCGENVTYYDDYRTWGRTCYKVYTTKKLYKYSLNRNAILEETVPESYNYQIETFKVTQEELLKTTNNIPNILYYLLDYAIVDDVGILMDHDDLMGIIYNQVGSSSSSGSTEDSSMDLAGNIKDFESSEGNFGMIVDLGNLLGMEGILGIKVNLTYDPASNTLSSLRIVGSGNNYAILDNFSDVIDCSLEFYTEKVEYPDDAQMAQYMARYEHFIEAFKACEEIYGVSYRTISGYSSDSVYTQPTNNPTFSGNVINLSGFNSYENKKDPYYGFIYGLNGYINNENP